MKFTRDHKLTERADFLRCYNSGRRCFSAGFVLFVRKRRHEDLPWRMGMAVTRKSGKAVVRNRLKRLLRESFRLDQHLVAGGCDYVIVPKRGLAPHGLTLADVRAELAVLLRGAAGSKPEPK